MSDNLKSHLALFLANLIYGVNYTVAKDVMPEYVQPFGFIFLRVTGALLLFWLLHSLYRSEEKIEKKDIPRLILCGLFGVALNQMLFFAGLNITTPINAAIILTSNPVMVLIASAFLLRERITFLKVLGIASGMSGAILLIFLRKGFEFDSSTMWGDLLVFLNAVSYGIYLVLIKPLMIKYKPLTVIKWVFIPGFIFVFPFGIQQAAEIDWANLPTGVWAAIAFVVIGTTFFAYLLNVSALKHVSPSVVSTYIYLQPVIAAVVALAFGKDQLDWVKVISAMLIFAGVYMVSVKPGRKNVSF